VEPGHPSFTLVHLLPQLLPFYFFLSFIGFTYFLLLSIPSLSTSTVLNVKNDIEFIPPRSLPKFLAPANVFSGICLFVCNAPTFEILDLEIYFLHTVISSEYLC